MFFFSRIWRIYLPIIIYCSSKCLIGALQVYLFNALWRKFVSVNDTIPVEYVTIIHDMWLLWKWVMSNCSKIFSNINSFTPQSNLINSVLFLYPFYRCQNWGIVYDLPKVSNEWVVYPGLLSQCSDIRPHALNYYMELLLVLLMRFD